MYKGGRSTGLLLIRTVSCTSFGHPRASGPVRPVRLLRLPAPQLRLTGTTGLLPPGFDPTRLLPARLHPLRLYPLRFDTAWLNPAWLFLPRLHPARFLLPGLHPPRLDRALGILLGRKRSCERPQQGSQNHR